MRAKKGYRPRAGKHWVATCAFFICSALAGFADQFGDFTYVEYDTTIEITDYPESAIGDVFIPNEIVGKPVTSIGAEAFGDCTGLTGVTIPDSVVSIGDLAFIICAGLTSVTIPDSVTSIGDSAFFRCGSLTNLTIPDSVIRIGAEAFRECAGLNSVTIGNGVTSIGEGMFAHCSILTDFMIHDRVTSIGDGAFERWTNHDVYPFVYVFDPPSDNTGTDIESAWLYYFEGSKTPRSFGVVTGISAGSVLFFDP